MLLAKLQSDLKGAQLTKNELKVGTLRLLISEINNARIQKGQELDDSEVQSVVQKELKKRKESAGIYQQANREDLASREQSEAEVLQAYLPAQLSDQELTDIVLEMVKHLGASSMSDMGRVIAAVMSKVGNQVEGARVSLEVKKCLGQNG